MKRIGPYVKALAGELGLENSMKLQSLRERWEELVGEALAGHLQPQSVREAVLHVTADSTLWLEHVTYYKEELLRRLKPLGIKDLRLKAGPPLRSRSSVNAPRKPRHTPLSPNEEALIEAALIPIKDEEIRRSFSRVMEKALRRKGDRSESS